MLNAVRHHGSAIQKERRGGCCLLARNRPSEDGRRAGRARSLNAPVYRFQGPRKEPGDFPGRVNQFVKLRVWVAGGKATACPGNSAPTPGHAVALPPATRKSAKITPLDELIGPDFPRVVRPTQKIPWQHPIPTFVVDDQKRPIYDGSSLVLIRPTAFERSHERLDPVVLLRIADEGEGGDPWPGWQVPEVRPDAQGSRG
jgi:hypothetical protein